MQDGVMVVLGLVLGAMLIFGLYLCLDLFSTAQSHPQVLPIHQTQKNHYVRGREGSVECIADLEEQCVRSNTTIRGNSVARLNDRIVEVRASNASVAFQTHSESPRPIAFGSDVIALQDLPPMDETKPVSFRNPFEDHVSPDPYVRLFVEPANSSHSPFSRFSTEMTSFPKDSRRPYLGQVSQLKVVSTSGDALLVPVSFDPAYSASSDVCQSLSLRVVEAPSISHGSPSVIDVLPVGEGVPGPHRYEIDEQFEDVDLNEPPQQSQRGLSRWENPRTAPSPPSWQLPGRDPLIRFSRH